MKCFNINIQGLTKVILDNMHETKQRNGPLCKVIDRAVSAKWYQIPGLKQVWRAEVMDQRVRSSQYDKMIKRSAIEFEIYIRVV